MSTSAPQSAQGEYVEFDEYIDFQLSKARTQIKWMDIATAAVGATVLVLAYLFAFTLLDHWVVPGGFSTTARAVMLGLLLASSVGWIAWKVARPYFKSVNRLYAARAIEACEPSLKGNLLSLVDLSTANRPVSNAIRRAIEKRAAVGLTHTDVDHAVDRRLLMQLCIALLMVVVACCMYAALSPKSLSFMRPLSTVEQPVATRTSIAGVRPGNVEILAGEHLAVMVETDGEKPEFVRALVSWDDGQFDDFPVELRQVEDGLPQYEGMILGDRNRGIVRNMTYYVMAGDARSDVYRVSVLQPPSVTVNQVEYRFPAYMGFENETRSTGNIESWEGVEVTVTATANMPLQSASVRCSDGEDLSQRAEEYRVEFLDTERTKLRARWKLELRTDESHPTRYRFDCTNQRGQSDPEPTLYSISIHEDEQPKVSIDAPQGNLIEQPSNGVIPLMISARDDFKVRFVGLRIQHGELLIKEEDLTGSAIFGGDDSVPQPSLQVGYDFRLNDRFKPNTKITIRVEARDNRDFPKDGQKGESREIVVLITEPKPPEDVQRQLDRQKQEQRNQQDPKQQNPDQNQKPNPQPNQGEAGKEPENKPDDGQQKQGEPKQGEPKQGEPKQDGENDEPSDAKPQDGQSKQSEGGAGGEGGKQQSQDGQGKSQPKEGGSSESANKPNGDQQSGNNGQSNRPAENDEALRDLYQKFKDENEQSQKPNQGQQSSDSQTPRKQPSDQPQDGKQETGDKPPQDPPQKKGDTKPDQQSQPGSKNEPSKRDPANNNDSGKSEQKSSDSGTGKPEQKPNDPGASPKPESGNEPPKSEPGEQSKPKPDASGGDGSAKPEDAAKTDDRGQKPSTGEKPKDSSNNPNGEPGAGGEDSTKPGAGNQSSGKQPDPKEDASGSGGTDGKPSATDKPGNQTEQPINGTEKTTKPEEGGRKDKAEGDETGTGAASKDPKSDATKAKNPDELKRREGDKPATTKKTGDATDTKPNPRPGSGEKPDAAKPNSDNTKQPESKPHDERRSTADGVDKKKPSDAKREGSPDGPNEDLKSRNDPKRSPQPSGGGAEGSSKQDDVGSRGSKDKGPGDTSNDPGQRQPADGQKTGQPGEKPGPGSTTKPTDRTQETPTGSKPDETQGRKPKEPQDSTEKRNPSGEGGSNQPGKPDDRQPEGDSSGGRDGNNERTPEGNPGNGGGKLDDNSPQKRDPRLQPPPAPKTNGAKANEDFNRQAAEFVLRKLEDRMERGEVDDKLLKDLGWTKDRVQEHMKWLRDGLQSRDAKPGSTSKGQFDEVLKSLDLRSPSQIRQGGTDNERTLDGVGAGRQKIPAKYRKQFQQYSRGLAEGR